MSAPARQIAVFGGTGTVGSVLVARALDAGYTVRALVRRPAALADAHGRLDLVVGDVRDREAVAATVAGSHAVLSTLGAGRGDDPTTRHTGTTNIVAAMQAAAIRRLIVMGGFHVVLPGDPGNVGQRLLTPILKLAPGIDHEDTEHLAATVLGCDRDWTLVRSVRVAPHRSPGDYRTGTLRLGPWSSVAPADVADFMLRCLDAGTEVNRAPMIAA